MDYDSRNKYFKQVKFDPYMKEKSPRSNGEVSNETCVVCNICGSIWTPGTLVMGVRLRGNPYSTATDGGSRFVSSGDMLELDQCPGCYSREGEWL